MNVANVGGSLTGGSTVALAFGGITAAGKFSKATFVHPDHTRLEPRMVHITATAPTVSKDDPGVARGTLQIAFANRVEAEGCCDVKAGTVIVDVGLRWPLSQPESLVDDVWALLAPLFSTAAVKTALVDGVLPTA